MKEPALLRIHANLPDWLDYPVGILASILMFALVFGYIGVVIWLAIKFSLWFLFLLLLTPAGRVRFGKEKSSDNHSSKSAS